MLPGFYEPKYAKCHQLQKDFDDQDGGEHVVGVLCKLLYILNTQTHTGLFLSPQRVDSNQFLAAVLSLQILYTVIVFVRECVECESVCNCITRG